jgi:hypothetical protein
MLHACQSTWLSATVEQDLMTEEEAALYTELYQTMFD